MDLAGYGKHHLKLQVLSGCDLQTEEMKSNRRSLQKQVLEPVAGTAGAGFCAATSVHP